MNQLRTGHGLTIAVMACALLISACGGSTPDATAPTIGSTDTVATTTEPTSPTTSSTTSTTEAEPTTETTAVTVDENDYSTWERPELEIPTEWEAPLDEVFGRYLLYWEALDIAFGPPFADPDYQPLLDLLDPGVVSSVQSQIQEYADADAVVIIPDDSLNDHGLRLPNPAVLEKSEGHRVVIQDCWIRDDIVTTLDGSSSEEHFKTLLWNVDMIVIDDEWHYFSATEADERSDGYQECQDLFDTLER